MFVTLEFGSESEGQLGGPSNNLLYRPHHSMVKAATIGLKLLLPPSHILGLVWEFNFFRGHTTKVFKFNGIISQFSQSFSHS